MCAFFVYVYICVYVYVYLYMCVYKDITLGNHLSTQHGDRRGRKEITPLLFLLRSLKQKKRPPESWFNMQLDECAAAGHPECKPSPGDNMTLQLTFFCGHHPTCRWVFMLITWRESIVIVRLFQGCRWVLYIFFIYLFLVIYYHHHYYYCYHYYYYILLVLDFFFSFV